MEYLSLYIKQYRSFLDTLISEKGGNLLDPEVIKVSQNLDILITDYYSHTFK